MRRKSPPRTEVAQEWRPRETTETEWRKLLLYGEQLAREQGIGQEDVARLVREYRAEVSPPRM